MVEMRGTRKKTCWILNWRMKEKMRLERSKKNLRSVV